MKDEHTYGKKMARNGLTKVIYKGTFVSIQSLHHYFLIIGKQETLESDDGLVDHIILFLVSELAGY